MIVRVNYWVERKFEIDNKFGQDPNYMDRYEQENFYTELLKETKKRLPKDAEISCIINDKTDDIIFED